MGQSDRELEAFFDQLLSDYTIEELIEMSGVTLGEVLSYLYTEGVLVLPPALQPNEGEEEDV